MIGIKVSGHVNSGRWLQAVKDIASVSKQSFEDEFRTQGKLLGKELVDRTPPFGGKVIIKMLSARGAMLSDDAIQDMTAQAVGKRRVELDIRRVIYGMKGAQPSERQMDVTKGKTFQTSWGALQKCEGKMVVRLFATKDGKVYGADTMQWIENPSTATLAATHQAHRTKRGRVTTAGAKDRTIGRWRFLNIAVTKEENVMAYIKHKQEMVGQAKGGWASLYKECGGRIGKNGWIGRHMDKAGSCSAMFKNGNVHIVADNNSAWAGAGDPDRIIQASFNGREKAMIENVRRAIEKNWQKGMAKL